MISGFVQAQLSTTENYTYSKTYLDYDTNNQPTKTTETVQYFDGLGRPKQIVNIKASPAGKDVVTTIPYDGFGRQVDTWLPAPMNTLNGGIQSGVQVAAQTYYGDNTPFVHKNLENSPLDRIFEQKQVGTAWSTKPVKFEYNANADGEVKKYNAVFNYSTFETLITVSAPYTANQLYKSTVTDEDGNKTIEFKNGKDQVVMVRKMISTTESTDTYYVYNDYNQLAYVLSPKAVDLIKNLSPGTQVPDTVLNTLCYQYKYDGKNRLVEKKLPGKDVEYMVYDKADRLILTQDANQRAAFSWLIYKYDVRGRLIYTGILNSNNTRTGMQNQINDVVVVESRNTAGLTANGMAYYYTNTYLGLDTLLSVNYYDSCPSQYLFNPTVSNILGEPVLTETLSTDGRSTKGLPVLSLIKNIEDDGWTKNYTYYDVKGRVIGKHSINHLGGYTRTESKLDFAGLPKQTITKHKRLETDTERIITENFEYDNQNRLLVHKHQVDSNPAEYLAQNTYNEISQLTSKKVGGIAVASPLQQIDYQYNIRGWLTKINDPSNLNGKLFGYEIKYQNPVNPQSVGKFNGNITEIDWNNGSENLLKRYNYEYDALNRLKNAFYKEPPTGNSGYFDEYLSYDANGNIMTLKRNAAPISQGTTFVQVDDLSYQYTGNRLDKVIESAMNDTGYEGGNNIIDYDSNGNMTTMKDKGIQSIVYNYLNLPSTYTISQNSPLGVATGFGLNYLYRADGTKVRKTYRSEGGKGSTMITTNMTDYLDGFQYQYSEISTCLWCRTSVAFEQEAFKNQSDTNALKPIQPSWILDFVSTAEGFYSFTENRYIYQYKDHLGNSRVSFAKGSTGTVEITDTNNYYAFGMNHIGINKGFLGGYKNYKYNGKEIQESGMYDYGARFYMPDLGRWGVIDPLAEKGQNFSPYNYAINNPIRFIDPDGMWISISDGQNTYRYANGQAQQQIEGKWLAVENKALSENVLAIIDGLNKISSGGDAGNNLISYFENDKNNASIIYDKGNAGDAGKDSSDPIKIDPKATAKTPTTQGLINSPFFVSLSHELGHKRDESNYLLFGQWYGVSRGEIFASHIENMIRAENDLPLRTSYRVDPTVVGGLDSKTVLIDCAGNSFYYKSASNPFEYNGRNGNEGEDRGNAARSAYGSAPPSVLQKRYNYYDNVKHTKKK
ncbi:cell wall-associated protein [Chryseobacterium sp. ON_d1]|nr:cell wall-associated protein [Chryseobacterium sp. ON_d1]